MTKYAEGIQPVSYEKDGRNGEDPASSKELSAFRGVIGALLWLSRCACPQTMGDTSMMASKAGALKVRDLVNINKLVVRTKMNVRPLHIAPPAPREMRWAAWVDAALANAQEGRTQVAWIVTVTDARLMHKEEAGVSLISWTSHRLQRVASSTLMTEMAALAQASAEIEWLANWWHCVMDKNYEVKHGDARAVDASGIIPSIYKPEPDQKAIVFTDSKSAYDILSRTKPSLSGVDRKAALEARVVMTSLSAFNGQVRWLPHERNIADGLTKEKGHVGPLIDVLTNKEYIYHPEPTVLAERATERQNTGKANPRPKHTREGPQNDRNGSRLKGTENGPECE
eukprot:6468988-Amphidinium_carterae.2